MWYDAIGLKRISYFGGRLVPTMVCVFPLQNEQNSCRRVHGLCDHPWTRTDQELTVHCVEDTLDNVGVRFPGNDHMASRKSAPEIRQVMSTLARLVKQSNY